MHLNCPASRSCLQLSSDRPRHLVLKLEMDIQKLRQLLRLQPRRKGT